MLGAVLRVENAFLPKKKNPKRQKLLCRKGVFSYALPMIPKSYRMSKKEIDVFFFSDLKKGKIPSPRRQYHTLSFFVITEPGKSFKVGIAVPKKVLVKAVARNAMRRQVLDAMEEAGFLTLPIHVFLSIKKEARSLPKENILSEVNELFEKIETTVN